MTDPSEAFQYIINYFIQNKTPMEEALSIMSIILIDMALMTNLDYDEIKKTFNNCIDEYKKLENEIKNKEKL
jgi:hypothetical protein